MIEKCQCPLFDGVRQFCPTHKFHTNQTERQLCETSQAHRDAMQRPDAPQHVREKRLIHKIKSAQSEPYPTLEMFPCIHRGESMAIRPCNLCGGDKGKPTEVFQCAIHGECSLGRRFKKKPGAPVSCAACPDRVETTKEPA